MSHRLHPLKKNPAGAPDHGPINSNNDRTQALAWLLVIVILRFAPAIQRSFYLLFYFVWHFYFDNKRWQKNKHVYEEFFVNVVNIYYVYIVTHE